MLKLGHILLTFIALVLPYVSIPVHAAWFEASGQAIIIDGNKALAKKQATQEAIKQALMFAGASITSVQAVSNGLLQNDRFEIRSGGEVNDLALVSETYHEDYVTIVIRADIFAQKSQCDAGQYKKRMVSAWFPIREREQAIAGGLGEFGQTVSEHFEQQFNQISRFARITQRQPYYISTRNPGVENDIITLARKTDNQYVLIGEITELSVERTSRNAFLFWQDAPLTRNFRLELSLYDGNNAALLKEERLAINSPWEFKLHQQVSPTSQQLWQSQFGQAVTAILSEQAALIDEALNCLPTYARVLQVNAEQLTVNIGQRDGVQVGDELTLFKHAQFFDSVGNLHQQLKLHPNKVKVTHVYDDTAVVGPTSSAPLANIQANDFVARQ
ncbi:MAG: flagellar assembly protein T N-terminal domain-containing protein [Paraglaciecola polaris]|uniref:flagella assembly protein FlgT n=1 Tax=Paraglaciecola polaris TaxID=222814 RepID=UPI0030034E01|tara:strand:- start:2301 stop:3461 length:1161 start_codon:yes stop_codon:yes gene_type:complete